jgi:hypothetical protein
MAKTSNGSAEGNERMTAVVHIYCQKELKRIASKTADKEQLPLSELFAKAMALYLNRPDLGTIPRKPLGRPRKEIAAS